MKIQLVSDLHLEFHKPQILGFGPELRITNAGADVLVLAGDICTARDFDSFLSFFEKCSKEFPHVIYIMGNHEHYKHTFNDTASVIRETVKGLPNFHFLDNESVMIDGVKFLGTTLWTDMNDGCPVTMEWLRRGMSDFHIVKYRDRDGNYFKFQPKTAFIEHNVARSFLRFELEDKPKVPTVVVSHHAPSFQSVHERYKTEHYMNGGYASDMEDFIHRNNHIKLWVHGHMHHPFDYMVGDTRVVCNPHGYPGERREPNTRLVLDVCEVEIH